MIWAGKYPATILIVARNTAGATIAARAELARL